MQSIFLVWFMCIIKSPWVIQLASFGYLGSSNACTKQNAGNDATREAAPWPDVYLRKMGQVQGQGGGPWSLLVWQPWPRMLPLPAVQEQQATRGKPAYWEVCRQQWCFQNTSTHPEVHTSMQPCPYSVIKTGWEDLVDSILKNVNYSTCVRY